ncbi:hypothetical protein [Carboxylicivirga sp. M1479]|uniref:hypothetical protein n=1 Tax=Carboxylicivirga sp. M1479 TaxID=2594476 RepID=UPI001178480C|nr:hypothetical protein [Carboxylicivirga sp. M1479]TRX71840.1 hypothetical protein FNN09_04265 [Carboxylicivirga sp. M1479]
MNRNNFKQVLLLMAMAFLLTFTTEAQMQPAKRIAPKVIKGVSLNATNDQVWDFVSQPKAFYEAIEEVQNLSCPNISDGAKLSFTLPADKNRKQEVSYFNKQEQAITYYITKSDYYHQPWVFQLLVGKDGDSAYVQFQGIFSIDDKKLEKKMIALVESEWLLLKKALEIKFK